MNQNFDVPIVLIPYRRPDTFAQVFAMVKKLKPNQLFVIADGPRNEQEKIKCDKARKVVDEGVNWVCEVHKNYSETNLNCGPRIATGLEWVFDQVDRAIILEDDCLPDIRFFTFAKELLEKYKNDDKVMQIAGLNTQEGNKKFQCDDSYYFSQIAQIWGWATWKRAWQSYDFYLESWPEIKKSEKIKKLLPDFAVRERWSNLFDNIYNNEDSRNKTWDVQWFYNVLVHNACSIVPSKNLITNIGFGEGSGTLTNEKHKLSNMKRYKIIFPLEHPEKIEINKQADNYTFRYIHKINNSIKKKVKSFFRHYLPKPYYLCKKLIKR